MARYLGPVSYGKFTYVISLINLFLPLYILGSEEVIISLFVRKESEVSKILASGFLFKFLGSIIAVICINLIAFYLRPSEVLMRLAILVYSLSMSFQVFGVINNFYQAKVEETKTSMIRNLVLIPTSLGKVFLILNGLSWEYFIWLSSIEVVLGALFYLVFFCFENKCPFPLKIEKKLFYNLFRTCLPFFLVLFLEQSLFKIDQLMVGEILGDGILGQYAAANKLINLWNFIPIAFISSIYPSLISGFEESPETYRKRRVILIGGLFWFSLIFAVGVTIVGEPIVSLLYGDSYPLTGPIIRLYSWITIFSYFTMARSKIYLLEGLWKQNLILMLGIFILNIVLNWFLIPVLGSWGAVWGTLVSLIFGIILMVGTAEGRALFLDWVFSIKESPKLMIYKLK